jgi:hypothetical protein
MNLSVRYREDRGRMLASRAMVGFVRQNARLFALKLQTEI